MLMTQRPHLLLHPLLAIGPCIIDHGGGYTFLSTAKTLVRDVVKPFIDDPLPALYEQNPSDKTGFDVLYSGARRDTTVG